jgi:hypothetical protein
MGPRVRRPRKGKPQATEAGPTPLRSRPRRKPRLTMLQRWRAGLGPTESGYFLDRTPGSGPVPTEQLRGERLPVVHAGEGFV